MAAAPVFVQFRSSREKACGPASAGRRHRIVAEKPVPATIRANSAHCPGALFAIYFKVCLHNATASAIPSLAMAAPQTVTDSGRKLEGGSDAGRFVVIEPQKDIDLA